MIDDNNFSRSRMVFNHIYVLVKITLNSYINLYVEVSSFITLWMIRWIDDKYIEYII